MLNSAVFRPVLALLSVLLVSLSMPAAAGAYLQLEGLEGDSKEKGHEGWIELLSISESIVSQSSVGPAGGAGGIPKVQFGPLQLVKLLDSSSVGLRQSLAAGTKYDNAYIDITSAAVEKPVVYFRYELKNVVITSISMSAAGDSVPVEDFAITFQEIKWIYTPQKGDGSKGDKVEAGWDITTNKPL